MSYWVSLERDGVTLTVARHSEGGTYAVGGVPEASLNVTYNYSERYSEHGFSLRELDGQVAIEWTARLPVVDTLGVARDDDYWKPTPGNAGYALSILTAWAREHPDAVFRVN